MKKIFLRITAFCAFAFLLSVPVFAQKDKTVSGMAQNYVISAKAGGVNYVEGTVTVLRKAGKSGYLIKNDNLEIGDKVTTGTNGKAEILLNPGSYVRLAENSEFEFVTTSLDDLKLKLTRGSAMLEVYADEQFAVGVNTPNTQFYAVKSGVYRVDVSENGTSKIEVWEGRAQIGERNATFVKEGRAGSVTGGNVTVDKFDRDEKDALEAWSKTRAKELAKINAKLERTALRDTLVSSYRSNAWSVFDSFGLWIYDASFSGYCFLPFGHGWGSPYGYYYNWNFWNIKLPRYIYNQTSTWVNPGNGNTNNGGNTNNNPPLTTRDRKPPFETIQDNGGSGIRKRRDNPSLFEDANSFPNNTQPIRVSPPPATTKPATTSDN